MTQKDRRRVKKKFDRYGKILIFKIKWVVIDL
jgi:hypothetical protein